MPPSPPGSGEPGSVRTRPFFVRPEGGANGDGFATGAITTDGATVGLLSGASTATGGRATPTGLATTGGAGTTGGADATGGAGSRAIDSLPAQPTATSSVAPAAPRTTSSTAAFRRIACLLGPPPGPTSAVVPRAVDDSTRERGKRSASGSPFATRLSSPA
jgi:hypothetical protein